MGKKYYMSIFIIPVFLIIFNMNVFAYSYSSKNSKIIVQLDDVVLNITKEPIIKNGVALIPIREISNAMKISVDWNQKTRTIICSKDDIYLTFVIDSFVMKSSEDFDVMLEVAPCLIDETAYIPLRAVANAFNSEIYWDDEIQTIFIYSPINTEDAVLASKLTKIAMYIYAINYEMCLDKGSYMGLAKVLKPEYEKYKDDFDRFSEIFNSSNPPFGKISIDYSNINSCEMKKAKKVLNLSEDSIDVLINEIKKFTQKVNCKIPDYADYISDITLYEKYIENYAVNKIDESLETPYIFKKKYFSSEKLYNDHIKKMALFKDEYMSDDSDQLIPPKEMLSYAEKDIKKILDDVKMIYINMGLNGKTMRNLERVNIKPLIKEDLKLTLYLKEFIKAASDLEKDKNGKTLKLKYADYQSKYNAMYIKTLDTYSKLFNLNQNEPNFSSVFDTITKMNDSGINFCVDSIKQLLNEWKYLEKKMGLEF